MTPQFPMLQNNSLYCEAALPRGQISETEVEYIRRKYDGKRTPRLIRYKISTARVIGDFKLGVDRLSGEDAAKEEEKRQREAAGASRG